MKWSGKEMSRQEAVNLLTSSKVLKNRMKMFKKVYGEDFDYYEMLLIEILRRIAETNDLLAGILELINEGVSEATAEIITEDNKEL